MSYYDRIAPGYDELHGEEQRKKLMLIIQRLRRETLPDGPALDVGCGTGESLDHIAEALGRKCVGVEPSKGMASQYRGQQEIILGSAEHLPFPDEAFAATVSITAIQNFSDVARGIGEIMRVTKRGSPLIISCLKRSGKLKAVAEQLAEAARVEAVIEEDKDIIFCCRRI